MNGRPHRPGPPHAARRIAKNSFILVASKTFEIAATIISTGLIARYLGVGAFGIFAMATAVSTALIPLADFGFERIICREISRNDKDSDVYVGTTFIVRGALSFIILASAYLLTDFFSSDPLLKIAVMISIAADLIWSLGMTYLSVVRAYERMEFELYINIVFKLCFVALIVAVISFNRGFAGIFHAKLISSILFTGMAAALLYRKFVAPRFSFDVRFAKFIIRESFPLAVSSLFITLIFRVDVFMLKMLGTPSDIALFEVPNRLIMQLQVIPVAFSLSLFPVLARSAAEGPDGPLSGYYGNSVKLLALIGVPASFLIFSCSSPLISIIFGKEYMKATLSMGILSPTILFLFIISLQNLFLTAVNRQALNTAGTAVALGLNIVLDVLLIPIYGFAGAAIASLSSYFSLLALNTWFIYRYGLRLNNTLIFLKILSSGSLMLTSLFIETQSAALTLLLRGLWASFVFVASLAATKTVTVEDLLKFRSIVAKRPGPEAALRVPEAAE